MKDWVWNIFMMTASLAFIELVLPEGNMQKYLKFIFSLIILAVIIHPFGDGIQGEIDAALTFSRDGQAAYGTEDSRMLDRILSTQTRQLEDLYREKAEEAGKPPDQRQNPGISLPWKDIYINDEEEPN